MAVGRTGNRTEVAVVGAGLAGITAALRLVEQGIEAIVLEARDRVGGRIFGIPAANGVHVELGAQWIGPSMKRMHRLIEQEGLSKVRTYRKGKSQYALMGKTSSGYGGLPPLSPLLWADNLQFVGRMQRSLRRIDAEAPWQAARAADRDAASMASFLNKRLYTDRGRAYWHVFLSEALSADTSEVSLLDVLWGMQTCGSIHHMLAAEKEWIREGAYSLITRLADKLGDRVKLNAPVRSIRCEDCGVQVNADGAAWLAQRVIVAVPPILAGNIDYSPPLPPRREQLTRTLSQGAVFKCIVIYERPFWREEGWSGTGYYDAGPIRATLDSSPPDRAEGVLVALVSGSDARRFSAMGQAGRRQAVLARLAQLFGPKALAAADYADKDWIADEWSLGGYGAHFRPGELTAFGDALYAPAGPIHWAGSETATDHRLYMEGAIQSGERAANEVMRALAGEPEPNPD